MHRTFFQTFLFFAWLTAAAVGQNATIATNNDATEIEAAILSYVSAFLARDVEKLAAHWSTSGVYTSRSSGEQIIGREAISDELEKMFEGEDVPKLAVATQSIEFISPNVALERGTATVTRGNNDAVESTYTAVYVKRGDKWLIDRMTEDEIRVEYSNAHRLEGLEWLIGNWTDEFDGGTIEIECKWTRNRNFISRTYRVSNQDEVASSGLQIIGWDPSTSQIRSWLFDSNGGFVSGTWQMRDSKWIVQSVATLTAGNTGSFTSIFRPLEDGTYTWQKVNRVLDGELLPNIAETVIHRN